MSNTAPRQPWTAEQRDVWYRSQEVKPHRDYADTIVPRIAALKDREGLTVETYGSVTYELNNNEGGIDKRTHDLYVIRVGDFDPDKPTHVITGGTHGYEKGGVEAALSFAENEAAQYAGEHNILIYPCLCPGPYEIEHRYTQGVIDPNRDALLNEAQSAEMQAFVASIQAQRKRLFGDDLTRKFNTSADLHETPLLDQTVILKMMEDLAGEDFGIDDGFPEGMFLITGNENNLVFAQNIIRRIRAEGHAIVDDEKLYGEENRGGVLLSNKGGTVSTFMAGFAKISMTTEFCGLGLHDGMPDKARAAPQLAVIRATIAESLKYR